MTDTNQGIELEQNAAEQVLDYEPREEPPKGALAIIFLIIFTDFLGFGIIRNTSGHGIVQVLGRGSIGTLGRGTGIVPRVRDIEHLRTRRRA